jgi:hypothetical protein
LRTKHVENLEIPCLDVGSTPTGSTKKEMSSGSFFHLGN